MKRLLCLSLVVFASMVFHIDTEAQTEAFLSAALERNSSDPDRLAAAWLPEIERLYEAIPPLSPREQVWLTEELDSSDEVAVQRTLRAMRTETYAIREAKRDVGSLLGSLRLLTGEIPRKGGEGASEHWRMLAYTLINYDAPMYLSGLVDKGVIRKKDMPFEWYVMASDDFSREDSIRAARVSLARHVLIEILPRFDSE